VARDLAHAGGRRRRTSRRSGALEFATGGQPFAARAPLNSLFGSGGLSMAGKFLRRGAIVDTIKSEHRTNAIQRREGLIQHPVTVTSCGCPDPNCGCWHTIRTERVIPTAAEADAALAADKATRKASKRVRKASAARKSRKHAEPGAAADGGGI
jgi:hypothetical protein